ncbi:hypothetical protein Aduo_014931 [Ancylostoma duodenale]
MVECLPLLTDVSDDVKHQRCSAGKERAKKTQPSNRNEQKSSNDQMERKGGAKKNSERKSKGRQKVRAKSNSLTSTNSVKDESSTSITSGKSGGKEEAKPNSDPKGSGLSPPRSAEIVLKGLGEQDLKTCPTMNSSIKEPSSMRGVFDKTQWERTRFAKEAAGLAKSAEGVDKTQLGEEKEAKEVKMLGESKQSMAVRGEYLNERPKFTVILLGIELVWCVVSLLVWGAAADNPILPQMLAIFNMLIVFLLILMCLSVEYFRFQVRREDTRSDTRYFVSYLWRYMLCEAHVARTVLLCANITIMAFDNDFDVGSVIVLAATPIHLIIASIHIFIALKPKRQ